MGVVVSWGGAGDQACLLGLCLGLCLTAFGVFLRGFGGGLLLGLEADRVVFDC